MSAMGSPRRSSSAGTVAMVQSRGSTSTSSSQVTGVDTVAVGVRRAEYPAAIVRSRAF